MTNILKDRSELGEKLQWLGAVINPSLFANKEVEETVSEDFIEDVMKQTGKSREEVIEMLAIEKGYDTVEEVTKENG